MKRLFPFLQLHSAFPVDSLRVRWIPLFPSFQRLGAFAFSPHPGVPSFPGLRLLTNGVSRLQTNEPMVLVDLLVMAIHFLQAGQKRATLPGAEESMTTTIEFITALFCQV